MLNNLALHIIKEEFCRKFSRNRGTDKDEGSKALPKTLQLAVHDTVDLKRLCTLEGKLSSEDNFIQEL